MKSFLSMSMSSPDAMAPFPSRLIVSAYETMSSAELTGMSAGETGASASNITVISDAIESFAGLARSSAEGMDMCSSSTMVSADTMNMSAGSTIVFASTMVPCAEETACYLNSMCTSENKLIRGLEVIGPV